ncbi:MAG: DUF1684 domain-containing protein [Flavobacteriaceae bacterium]
MKHFIFLLFTSVLISSCDNSNQLSYQDQIKEHQYQMNLMFNDSGKSPLKAEDLKSFSHLEFFPIDSLYRVKSRFVPIENGKILSFPTNTDRVALYLEYAKVYFKLHDKEQELTLYLSQNTAEQDYLFLPFFDLTNGTSSYDGGRYLDLEVYPKKNQDIWIDFNLAYNPYCAYNDRYSCPIPPLENSLDIEIPAGVKKYH